MEVAIVDASGKPREFDVFAANFGLSASCKDGLLTYLRQGKWIPATHNGQFVESIWTNPRVVTNVRYKRQQ